MCVLVFVWCVMAVCVSAVRNVCCVCLVDALICGLMSCTMALLLGLYISLSLSCDQLCFYRTKKKPTLGRNNSGVAKKQKKKDSDEERPMEERFDWG